MNPFTNEEVMRPTINNILANTCADADANTECALCADHEGCELFHLTDLIQYSRQRGLAGKFVLTGSQAQTIVRQLISFLSAKGDTYNILELTLWAASNFDFLVLCMAASFDLGAIYALRLQEENKL